MFSAGKTRWRTGTIIWANQASLLLKKRLREMYSISFVNQGVKAAWGSKKQKYRALENSELWPMLYHLRQTGNRFFSQYPQSNGARVAAALPQTWHYGANLLGNGTIWESHKRCHLRFLPFQNTAFPTISPGWLWTCDPIWFSLLSAGIMGSTTVLSEESVLLKATLNNYK